jgi:hypothetical protein
MPRIILDMIDFISYKRAVMRDRLHSNFSYYKNFHVMPKYYSDIVSEIMRNNGKN